MKQAKKKQTAPSGKAALITALCLLGCAVGSIVIYLLTAYLPLLLVGILQALPAVANLLLMTPIIPKKEPPAETEPTPTEPPAETEPTPTEATDEEAPVPTPKRKPFFARVREWFVDFWANSRETVLLGAVLTLITGANVYFWIMFAKTPRSYGLGYHIPVILVAFFVFYIVLDKWCKHAGDDKRVVEEGEDPPKALPAKDAEERYHQAQLHGLRGALSAGRWSQLVIAIALMIRLMGYGDYVKITNILLALLFVYETAFLTISLVVRYIRHEISTAPELSIPMPGLGGEDLGVISYLEKNTGITMRSLWSIRLIKRILPYTVLAVVLLLWGFSGVVKIEPYQEGAHYRLGRLQEETLQPGLHVTLPWPFDSVEVYNTRVVNTVTIGYISEESTDNIWTQSHGSEEYKLLLGGGNELVSINLRIAYRIENLKAYLASSTSPEALLQSTAYEIVTAKTIGTDLDTLLSVDRGAFAQSFKEDLIEKISAYHTGLDVMDVVLESIHPPVEIADVYQQLISAGIEAERIVLAAMGEESVLLIEANSKYYTIVGAEEAQKIASIAAANAEVAELMWQLQAEEDWSGKGYNYRQYKRIQAIQAIVGQSNMIILDKDLDADFIKDYGDAKIVEFSR
ncbi:MAG: hypothetical protein E7585_05015 [Ruminococcaceae bacterium]|nr:hypothetical protein [Oscillospiraceae bacterium]